MKYVLIIIVTSYGQGTAIQKVDFNSKASCEYAAQDIVKAPALSGLRVYVKCYPTE